MLDTMEGRWTAMLWEEQQEGREAGAAKAAEEAGEVVVVAAKEEADTPPPQEALLEVVVATQAPLEGECTVTMALGRTWMEPQMTIMQQQQWCKGHAAAGSAAAGGPKQQSCRRVLPITLPLQEDRQSMAMPQMLPQGGLLGQEQLQEGHMEQAKAREEAGGARACRH